ncbi:hypothetical protein [Niveispirillum fermenti]|uniref:hypothetical protein n=1 Tax=Niveispirillum fermenti TaxID=1233113 RepID=UPI003A8440F5
MRLHKLGSLALAALLSLSVAIPPAVAGPGDRDRNGYGRDRQHGQERYDRGRYDRGPRHDHGPRYDQGPRNGPRYDRYYGPPPGWYDRGGHHVRHWDVPPARRRVYHDVVVVRPHGHWYSGYGHYRRDNDALAFLGLTAISLLALNALSETQQRAHEEAQIRATTAPIGQPVIWSDGGYGGSVTPLREGRTPAGAYCREFQQQVIIGGRREDAYGTACMQPDGAWQVVG